MTSPFPLRLIQFKAGYNLPVHAAVEVGHLAGHGLRVQVGYTPGSAYLMEALRAGEFEVGHTSADDVVAEVERTDRQTLAPGGAPDGSEPFVFMGLHGGLLSLVGSPGSPDVESLRGRPIAVDARTTGFVFILERWLRSKGFGPQDYDLVEVGGWESRFRGLLEGRVAATLLTPPYVGDALEAGCHLLARGEEMTPVYQATCGVTTRRWARENADALVGYIRAYVEATGWCFDPQNREGCLDLLARHHGVRGPSAERTLDALLDPERGLYPRAEVNLAGVRAALELRAEMGHLARPVPPPEKYVDLTYHRMALPSS